MASAGTLVTTMGATLGVPQVTVGSYYRALREAGFIGKSAGRGRSAAHVTFRDASRLLIAILGTGVVQEAPAAVQLFSDLRSSFPPGLGMHEGLRLEFSSLPPTHRFEDGLSFFLQSVGKIQERDQSSEMGAEDIYKANDIDFWRPEWTVAIDSGSVTCSFSFLEHEFRYYHQHDQRMRDLIPSSPNDFQSFLKARRQALGVIRYVRAGELAAIASILDDAQ